MRTGRGSSIVGLLAVAALLALAGCEGARDAKLSAGPGAASFAGPNRLIAAFTIRNDGAEAVHAVKVDAVTIAGATLASPTPLPTVLGTIGPHGQVVLDAGFTSPAARDDAAYLLTVSGTAREDGRDVKFTLKQTVRTPPGAPGSRVSGAGSTVAHHVTGAPYPAAKPSFGPEVNENGHAPPIPLGPPRPLTISQFSTVKPAPKGAGGGGGSASIDFSTNDPLGGSSNTIAEPSGASGGGVVFETANSHAAFSIDGGATFTQLNPTTIFPNGVDGGFCCDQIVQYVPSIDRFIWVMQYGALKPSPNPKTTPTYGPNLYRVAFASPADVKSSSGTSWSYFDITSTAVLGATSTSWLDYPDTSYGDSSFYLSFDDVNGGGHVVVRVPLSDIQAAGTINFRFTTGSDSALAYGGHITQNTQDQVFWAGHKDNSTLRVFQWAESSTSYSWSDIAIGSWPKTNATTLMTSTTPDSQDWLNKLSGFPGNAVLGLARSPRGQREGRPLLYLAWTGAIGNGFKQPQVQWVKLDINDSLKLVSQQQVWNAGYAYAYPAFAVNNAGEIGMSLEWGGGGNYENHVAGFWGDYVVYETTSSDIGTTRFGDYVSIRQNTADASKFDAFGYGLNKAIPPAGGTTVDVRYLVFSR